VYMRGKKREMRGRTGRRRERDDACDPSFFEKQLLSIEETGKRNALVSACVCVLCVCLTQTRKRERESRKEEQQERQARSDGARQKPTVDGQNNIALQNSYEK